VGVKLKLVVHSITTLNGRVTIILVPTILKVTITQAFEQIILCVVFCISLELDA
jgi:hypothetical protein